MASDCLVIVTVYNEADRSGATLDALARAFPGAPVILADDGSADATPEIARAHGARVVRSERVIGKGAAASAAAESALRAVHPGAIVEPGEHPDPIFILCDGDLEESARELPALAEKVRSGEADLAVAAFARRLGGGIGLAVAFARWAIHRRCGLRTTAPISGQRALHAGALRAVLPFAQGLGMELGMTIDAVRAGYRVAEVELELTHRATSRTPAGFAHRARQLADFVRAYVARG